MNVWTGIGIGILLYGLTRNEPLKQGSLRRITPRRAPAQIAPRPVTAVRQTVAKVAHQRATQVKPELAYINRIINTGGSKVIFFLARWCPHCQGYLKDGGAKLHELAKSLKAKLYYVDLNKDRELGAHFKVGGFPTIRVYRSTQTGRTEQTYEGPRGADLAARLNRLL